MNSVAISIILPAYNCEKYIGKAIKSLLEQSFDDFELIIINDGSTDKTESIIQKFIDPRIIYLKNIENEGLIFTLNRAIDLANGKYIARMDSDDICLPTRLAKQKTYLDQHIEIAVIACTVELIDEKDEKTGIWKLDRQTLLPGQIKKALLTQNCIAHPSIMIRAEVAKKLRYKANQKNIEDYDLWLRLMNRGYQISKLKEPLLLYRIHSSSITGEVLKNSNVFFRHFKMKMRFLWSEIFSGNLNIFTIQVKVSMFTDIFKGIGKSLKNI